MKGAETMPPWTISEEGSTLKLALAGDVLGWQDIERMLDAAEPSFEAPSIRSIEIDLMQVESLAVGAIGILLAWKAEIDAEGKRLRFTAERNVAQQLARFGLADSFSEITELTPLPRR
ncbi:MAG: STAS domain-containing protein [Actinomycetota bacterium]|nr:STAS domain-containing protein [Actinomycetota bacterium]